MMADTFGGLFKRFGGSSASDGAGSLTGGGTTGSEEADKALQAQMILSALGGAANANKSGGEMVDLGNGYKGFLKKQRSAKVNDALMGLLGGASAGISRNQGVVAQQQLQQAGEQRDETRYRDRLTEQMNAQDAGNAAATRDKLMMYAAQNGQDLSGLGAENGPPASKEMLLQKIAEGARADGSARAQAEAAIAGQDAQGEQRSMILDLINSGQWNEGNAKALGLPWTGGAGGAGGLPAAKEPGAVHQGVAEASGQQDKALKLIEALKAGGGSAAEGSAALPWYKRLFQSQGGIGGSTEVPY